MTNCTARKCSGALLQWGEESLEIVPIRHLSRGLAFVNGKEFSDHLQPIVIFRCFKL